MANYMILIDLYENLPADLSSVDPIERHRLLLKTSIWANHYEVNRRTPLTTFLTEYSKVIMQLIILQIEEDECCVAADVPYFLRKLINIVRHQQTHTKLLPHTKTELFGRTDTFLKNPTPEPPIPATPEPTVQN